MLFWLDMETTGLDPAKDHILEVAWTITQDDLSEHLLDLNSMLVTPTGNAWSRLSETPYVVQMHEANGLSYDLEHGETFGLHEVEERILQDIEAGVPDDEQLMLAGTSVMLDRRFIEEQMPELHKRLSYRLFDVRTLLTFMHDFAQPDSGNIAPHRAQTDIEESIRIARGYRAYVKNLWYFDGETKDYL